MKTKNMRLVTGLIVVALGMTVAACGGGGKSTNPPVKGAVKPEKPVLVRASEQPQGQKRSKEGELKQDFDFVIIETGMGEHGVLRDSVLLQQARPGVLMLQNSKQGQLELRYRLDEKHPQLILPQELKRFELSSRNEVEQGALVKHLSLSTPRELLLGMFLGQQDSALAMRLPGGWSATQGAMLAEPVRRDKHCAFYTMPMTFKARNQSATLLPGEEKSLGGMTVRLLESETRVMDPNSKTATALLEGGAYSYRFAIYR